MKNAKTADKKKDFNGKIAGLTVLEALFYILSLPLIVILSLVFCIKTYELVPYYSFWPFVGVLLAGVLCLVFVIVVMCVSMRKKSKRTILMQTVSIIVAALMLTGPQVHHDEPAQRQLQFESVLRRPESGFLQERFRLSKASQRL